MPAQTSKPSARNSAAAKKTEANSSWRNKLENPGFLCCLLTLLVLATIAVYFQVAGFDFVNYDDPEYVTSNAHVQGGLNWKDLWWAFHGFHASNWHPLTWVSHMFDCQLFGLRPGRHHLVSLSIHLANTLLVFLVLRRMTSATGPSGLVAGFFALHPLHVESVAWISERKDVLSGFFFLLTLWAYAEYVLRSKDSSPSAEAGSRITHHALVAPKSDGGGSHSPTFYALSLIAFSLGLMSKPMLVSVPFLLLLLDFWPLQRFHHGANGKPQASGSLGLLFIEKLPFFILALGSCVITLYAQSAGGAVSTSISRIARVANALVSYARYLGKAFWPWHLSVLYPHPGSWPLWQVITAGILVVGISVVALFLARTRPYFTVGWFWFVLMLGPTIGLIQVGIQSMADRYTYLPLIGLAIAVVWTATELLAAPKPNTGQIPLAGMWAGFAALAACAVLTFNQAGYWRDSEKLFRHTVQVTHNNYLAYNNLGFYLANHGRGEEAMENYRAALKIQPNYEDARNNLGYALAGQKKFAEAIEQYQIALRIRPNHPEVHNNLGNALSELGRIDEAITNYEMVLQQNPDHADAHNNLGIALAMKGKLEEAIVHFHEALRCKPSYASAHSNLGNALAAQHKLDEAIQEYQQALKLKSDDAQAQNNLANALSEQGKVQDAIGHYQEALRLNADNPEAHCNLGIALARLGDRTNAAEHFRQALKLKPDYAAAKVQLDSLGK